MTEDNYRMIVARVAAHDVIINTLLRWSFQDLDVQQVRVLAEAIKAGANDTSFFTDRAKGDEARAERLADTVIQMQTEVAKMVDGAVAAFEKVMGAKR